MDDATVERVRDVIAAIPAGKVATYGDISNLLGLPSPRMVGRLLAEDGHDLPWHRVLRANGTPAPHLAIEQFARLRAEGVFADDGKVDLATHRWQELVPEPPAPEPDLFSH